METRHLAGVVTVELALLRVVPLLPAIVHSGFAPVPFTHGLAAHGITGDVWPGCRGVAGLYGLCMVARHLGARSDHARAVIG